MQLGECASCGKWYHLRSQCAGVSATEYTIMRKRWRCAQCAAGDSSDEDTADSDGSGSASDAGTGWWTTVPEGMGLGGLEPVQGSTEQARGAIFRNVAREYRPLAQEMFFIEDCPPRSF